jgi:hypothetical protein
MLTIYDNADMARILSGPIDPDLKIILQERLELLAEFLSEWDLGDLAHFIIVEPGDSMGAITRELTVCPTKTILGDVCFPDPAFEPSWEHCIARDTWFDLTFALSDSGLGHCLLVPDHPGVDPDLLELCRAYATPAL